MSTQVRWAMIRRSAIGGPTREVVERYLPSNYEIVNVTGDSVLIKGTDNAGWTLDGYVIPRFASGLIWAEEVPGPDPAESTSPHQGWREDPETPRFGADEVDLDG